MSEPESSFSSWTQADILRLTSRSGYHRLFSRAPANCSPVILRRKATVDLQSFKTPVKSESLNPSRLRGLELEKQVSSSSVLLPYWGIRLTAFQYDVAGLSHICYVSPTVNSRSGHVPIIRYIILPNGLTVGARVSCKINSKYRKAGIFGFKHFGNLPWAFYCVAPVHTILHQHWRSLFGLHKP